MRAISFYSMTGCRPGGREAQVYLASRGFANRQIRNTTANKGTRYDGKIVGDSPEMCRALDSHGFAYLKAGLFPYASFNSLYPEDDPAVSTSASRPSFLLPSSAHGVSPPPASVLLKISSSSPMCSVRSSRRAAVLFRTRSFAVCDQVAWAEGSVQSAPKVRKHQRLMEMASTVPHIEDTAKAKAMIRSGLQGRALMESP